MTVGDFGQKEVWSTDCSEILTEKTTPGLVIHISYFKVVKKVVNGSDT